MDFHHGHETISLDELSKLFRYSIATLKRWLERNGVIVSYKPRPAHVRIADVARCFGISTNYLSLLLRQRDGLLNSKEASAALGLSQAQLLASPIACQIDRPGIRKRYSRVMVEGISKAAGQDMEAA